VCVCVVVASNFSSFNVVPAPLEISRTDTFSRCSGACSRLKIRNKSRKKSLFPSGMSAKLVGRPPITLLENKIPYFSRKVGSKSRPKNKKIFSSNTHEVWVFKFKDDNFYTDSETLIFERLISQFYSLFTWGPRIVITDPLPTFSPTNFFFRNPNFFDLLTKVYVNRMSSKFLVRAWGAIKLSKNHIKKIPHHLFEVWTSIYLLSSFSCTCKKRKKLALQDLPDFGLSHMLQL